MEGYEVYQTYLALKLHFTKENYNFFIFSGKTRASKQSFEKRKDKYFFKKLGRKFEREELINFFVSHFIHDDGAWIGNISVYKSKVYAEWKSKIESLSFIFKNEMENLLELSTDFDSLFKINNGSHPILLKQHLSGSISLESFVILNKLVNFIPYFNKNIAEPVVWPEIRKKVVKYEPFLAIDKDKYKCTLLSLCDSLTTM